MNSRNGQTSLFALNRDLSKPRTIEIVWEDAPGARLVTSEVLTGDALKAVNSFEAPNKVHPANGRTRFEVPARSYTVLQWSA